MKATKWITMLIVAATGQCQAGSMNVGDFTVEFGTRSHNGCSFLASPVDYCDDEFIDAYKKATAEKSPDFRHNLIVVAIDTRPEYAQQALVVLNPKTKTIFPLPFDHFSRSFSGKPPKKHGTLAYSKESDELCVDGAIMAYRSVQNGRLCWRLAGSQFVGEITPYTYPDH